MAFGLCSLDFPFSRGIVCSFRVLFQKNVINNFIKYFFFLQCVFQLTAINRDYCVIFAIVSLWTSRVFISTPDSSSVSLVTSDLERFLALIYEYPSFIVFPKNVISIPCYYYF